jgi:hypothetical protein
MLLGSTVIALIFAITPSLILLRFAAPNDRKKPRTVIMIVVILLFLFYAQEFLYLLISPMVPRLAPFFLAFNLNLYICLLIAPFLMKASTKITVSWALVWFLVLIIPGGYWFLKLLQVLS